MGDYKYVKFEISLKS